MDKLPVTKRNPKLILFTMRLVSMLVCCTIFSRDSKTKCNRKRMTREMQKNENAISIIRYNAFNMQEVLKYIIGMCITIL